MAANDANIATIRKRHEVYPYLSIAPEAEVLRGTISGTYGDQVTSVTYSNVTGSYNAVAEDMEAEIFTSGGVSKGRVRVALGGATSTVVQIEEVSPGRVKIVSGDQIRIYRSWRLRSRLVASSETFDKDSRVTYSNQTDTYAPVAIIGGGKAGFIDPATSVLTVSLSASTSYVVDPDSGGTLTYLWDVQDGTITVGTSSTASITATFPAGARWISLTVTDSSNSKTYTQYAPIWAHELTGSNAPIQIANVQLSATMEEGWAANFDLVDAQSESTIKDGALGYIWTESSYDGTAAAYGSDVSDRSTIKWVGYLVRNVESADGEDDGEGQTRSAFSALSPLAILARLAGFSQVMEYSSSPASWFDATDLSVKVALDYLIRWGTTFMRVHDWIFAATDAAYPAFYIQENTPLGQVRELADALDAQVVCTRLGRVRVQSDLLVSSSTARSAASTQLTIGDTDYISVQYDKEHRYQYAQIELRAITPGIDVSSQQPVFVVGPGLAPVEGAPQRTVYDRRIGTLADCKNRVGWLFARDNSVKDGLPVRSNILLKLWIGYDVFDLFNEWVVLNIAPSLLHGSGFSSARCVIRAITVTYTNDGAGELTLTLQEETNADAGVELPQAQPDVNNDNFTPIPEDFPYLFDIITIDPTPENIVKTQPTDPTYIFAVGVNANTTDNEAYLGLVDWSTTPPTVTWDTIGTGITGTYCWSRGDPYNPYRKYIATSTGMWKIENISTPTSPVQVATLADMFGGGATTWPAFFEMSNNRKGFMVVMAGTSVLTGSGGGIPTSGAYTTDYCATWTTFDIAGGSPTFSATGGMYSHSIGVSPYNNPNAANQGWFYSAYYSAASTVRVMRSTDWCASWSQLMTITVANTTGNNHVRVFTPYTKAGGTANKNDANQRTHFVSWTGNQGEWGTFDVAGNLYNNVSPSLTGNPMGQSDLLPMNTLTNNGSYYYLVSHRSTSGVGVLRSTDAGAAFVDGAMDPSTSGLAIGSEANGSPFSSSLNGWGTEGTLIHFSPGHSTNNLMHTAYTQTTAAGTGTVKTAYTTLGDSNAVGFLRIKRSADSDWAYILTPAYRQKIAYAEYQLIT